MKVRDALRLYVQRRRVRVSAFCMRKQRALTARGLLRHWLVLHSVCLELRYLEDFLECLV